MKYYIIQISLFQEKVERKVYIHNLYDWICRKLRIVKVEKILDMS